MIRFENVTKTYRNGIYAVRNVDLEIREGEFFVLIGPSGSGKTTMLKMINRLIPISEGTIRIQDKKISEYDIHELRWDIGYVLQDISLFPHMTIEENISIVPEMKKWEQRKISQRIDELLDMVGLEPDVYRKRKPNELSGGQQQRIGVARALAANPPIILMDEPFSALDPISREMLQDDLLKLQKQIRKTIVFVTHDMKEALKLGERICLMKDGEVVQTGTPEEILKTPANKFVREFVGINGTEQVNVLEAIQPVDAEATMNAPVVPNSAGLPEILALLSDHAHVVIMENGTVVGMIDRQSVIRLLSHQMEVN
ncbi:ABC transporter ATP-binding protein [Bacillus sp. EB01]|uniref:ABC transporter ATP-binding protein n=1 Tax=Bacillus sp. EB01 TaxID=1347086 RepID=UPI0005C71C5D|nr:ABC transporter ATP-binding protein [Bacillus sp. EB01]